MKITPIKSQYEKSGKVQIMHSTACNFLTLTKNEVILPVGNSKNSFKVDGYYVTLNELNKIQYRLLTSIHGYSGSFIAFTKVNGKVFMLEMSKREFESKKTKVNCTLTEKDRIINGLKQPNTVILYEDGHHVYYADFPGMQKDNFNLATEDEILKKEADSQNSMRGLFSRAFGLAPVEKKADLENVDIDLYGRQGFFSRPVYAIEFLSDTEMLCTGLYVKMKGRDNYEVSLDEIKIDLEKVYEELKARNAFKWNEENCLYDPNRKTLHNVDKKRKQVQNCSNEDEKGLSF